MTNRVITIVAHIDHGKTSLIDTFLAHRGYIPNSLAGDIRYLDSRKDEQFRGITLKNSIVSIKDDIIIDTPGHVDFESLIISASKITDYYILLIDVTEGITPRTLSLMKFIDIKKTVLVLNKIDKLVNVDEITILIYKLNSIIGSSIFEWKKNNIVIASAKYCLGLNYQTLIEHKGNSIINAFKGIKLLEKKYNDHDLNKIVNKYKIKVITRKTVFSHVFPLITALYNSLDYLSALNSVDSSLENSLRHNNTLAVFSFCILKRNSKISRENVLFVFRVFETTISYNDEVYCCYKNGYKKVTIDGIFLFKGDDLVEVKTKIHNEVVCISGDFVKDSILSKEPVEYTGKKMLSPLYFTKLSFSDYLEKNQLIKDFFVVEGLLESNLKVHRNRNNEYEIKCSGKIQFEKILEDISSCQLQCTKVGELTRFVEFATTMAEKHYYNKDYEFIIGVMPHSKLSYEINTKISLVESLLNLFVKSGSLIRENIVRTKFSVNIIRGDSISILSVLHQKLTAVYLFSSPSICPKYFSMDIVAIFEYLGVIYAVLGRYKFHFVNEEPHGDLENYISIQCKIPQCYFKEIIDEIRLVSKGTAYVEAAEDDFFNSNAECDDLIEIILKEKGLLKKDKIIDEPEKQRTLGK